MFQSSFVLDAGSSLTGVPLETDMATDYSDRRQPSGFRVMSSIISDCITIHLENVYNCLFVF